MVQRIDDIYTMKGVDFHVKFDVSIFLYRGFEDTGS